MKKQILSAVVITTMISLCNTVNAEPVNCDCDCHKVNRTSNIIEIGYPTKSSPSNGVEIPAVTSESQNRVLPSAAQTVVTTSTPATQVTSTTPATSSSATANLTNPTYSGGVSKTTAHFGNNVADAEGNQIVNAIGKKLMKAAGINKNVYFVYSTASTVNAYTEFNGTVTVFKGIMGCCENEDELAFVIGHELGHADGYHVAKKTATNVALGVGGEQAKKVLNKNIGGKLNTFGLQSGTWSDKAVTTTQNLGAATYSKAHENDADLKAVDYLVKCGYNPLAGISVLNKLSGTYPDLFEDHPSTDKRVQNIYAYVQEKYPQYISQGYNSASYREALQTYVK